MPKVKLTKSVKSFSEISEQPIVNEVIDNGNRYNNNEVIESTNQPLQYKGKKPKNDNMPPEGVFPEHLINIALLIKNNAEIRRFTSLGIINYLLQKGEISGNNRYVTFRWNKFCVKCNGLVREYSYTESFFLNCLVASFASFSASAQKTIDIFTRKELKAGMNKVIYAEEVSDIIEMNNTHTGETSSDEVNELGEINSSK